MRRKGAGTVAEKVLLLMLFLVVMVGSVVRRGRALVYAKTTRETDETGPLARRD